jgi:DNA-directed RNA polymerase
VGAALTNLLLNTARVKVPGPNDSAFKSLGDGSDGGELPDLLEVPAFYHDYTFHKGQKYGTISWHEAFYGFMDDEHMIRATLSPVRYMPMVTPPRPWTRFNAGGYLRSESIVMRGHYSLHGPSKKQMLALHAAQSGAEVSGAAPAFQPVLDALNVLGKTAWVINDPVLRVMEEVWARGGGKAGVPPRANVPDPAWPRAPYGLRFGASRAQMLASSIPTREDVSGFIKDLNRAKQTNRELHSQRCDFLIKLQVAKDMRFEKRIYFPHNIDFRGRAYTMHVHLNHLGSDVCRGALMFAEERPLGPDGLKWLCVQAANLYGGGVDKLPMDERARWIADRFDVVRAVAADPLSDSGSFWLDAEDPWQCLATCFEIDKAIESGNPETYMCRLPVHQDGSCNGLQHYAALGRDEAGGEQVNLMPRDRPGDVYTGIAMVLKKIVAEDLQNAEDPETQKLASLLAPHVDRKLVKQTVMTSVYGVTHVGARQQIQNRLKERGAVDDENTRYRVATYAASRTLDALSNLFVNARDVMAWLAECARLVAGRGKAVEWTTPMGLPVVQPYRAKGRKVIRTLVQSFVLQFDNDENKVQKNKQRSAFPPNYIHSVDSAHMMKTAVACHAAGLTFAGVHDSFWTHAGDVPEMSKHIREKFIELHSEPLLEQLYEELKQKYPEIAMELPPPPPPGSMDLQSVRDSVYFFS